ncbi:unnamed protein product, partial [Urochloa humidicola]
QLVLGGYPQTAADECGGYPRWTREASSAPAFTKRSIDHGCPGKIIKNMSGDYRIAADVFVASQHRACSCVWSCHLHSASINQQPQVNLCFSATMPKWTLSTRLIHTF